MCHAARLQCKKELAEGTVLLPVELVLMVS